MQGLTMTCTQTQHCQEENVEQMLTYPRPFFSLEPLMGELSVRLDSPEIEKVIVGAMTGPGAVEPKKEFIQSVIDNVPKNLIYWKKNILSYVQ
jgi:protein gp37